MPIVFEGRVFSVEVETRRHPNGRVHEDTVVRHPPSVVLIPIAEDGRVILIRQYRVPLDRFTWEIPAGSLDPGEAAEAAASRECEEEIRLVPGRLERLGAWFPVPGYGDEEMIFFKASKLHPPPPDSPHKPDADEDIETRAMSLDDARVMVRRGDIVDLKTAFALTLV